MSPTRLDSIARSHPILPIVFSKKEALTNSTLPDFIEHELANHPDGRLPLLLSDFYGDYLDFVIIKQLKFHRNLYAPKHYRWNIRDTVDRLSKVAFLNYVRNVKITEGILKKVLAIPKEKPILAGTSNADHGDLDFRTFYLFNKETNEQGKVVYTFRESIVLEYLVAHYQALECIRKVANGKETSVLTTAMRDSMKKLPATGDIWRVTFGLLNMDAATREIQKYLLEEIIEETKNAETMNSFDITSLCVESIYESQNVGEMAELIDEFTLNETLNYSNVELQAARYPYTICAVGYLVRASPEVYGLHMSNFNLNEERLNLLADPVNAVSDNNLQVLNLSHNPIGDKGMKKLQRFIVKASLLTHLDLHECNIGDMGLALLSEFFMCLPLRYLRVSNNGITDKGLSRLCTNLHYIPTIEWLDFSGNNLTDKSVIKLGAVVSELPNLRCLDLRKNSIGDAGADAISKALSKTNTMSHVMLAENKIGESGAESLANTAWKTKSLRYVNLSLNHIPQAGVLGLRKAEDDHGDLKIIVGNQGLLDESRDLDTTGVSEGESMNFRESSVEKDTPLQTWERSTSMDLLAGRPDKTSSIIHKKMMKKHRSLPRLDLKRSWQGASYSFRESVRSVGSSTLPRRSSGRENQTSESPTVNRRSATDTFRRAGDTLRRSTGNIRDSFRRGGSQVRDSITRSSHSLRRSLNKKKGDRRSPETDTSADTEQPSTSKKEIQVTPPAVQKDVKEKDDDKEPIQVDYVPVAQSEGKKPLRLFKKETKVAPPDINKQKQVEKVIEVDTQPIQKDTKERQPSHVDPIEEAHEDDEGMEESGEYILDEKPSRRELLRKPLKFFSRKKEPKDEEEERKEEPTEEVILPEQETNVESKPPNTNSTETKPKSRFIRPLRLFNKDSRQGDKETQDHVEVEPKSYVVQKEDLPEGDDDEAREHDKRTSARDTLMKPIKYISDKLHHKRETPTPEREEVNNDEQKKEDGPDAENNELPQEGDEHQLNTDESSQEQKPKHSMKDTISKPFKALHLRKGNKAQEEVVEVATPAIDISVETKEVIAVGALDVQTETHTKKKKKIDKGDYAEEPQGLNQSTSSLDDEKPKRSIKATIMKPFQSLSLKKEQNAEPDVQSEDKGGAENDDIKDNTSDDLKETEKKIEEQNPTTENQGDEYDQGIEEEIQPDIELPAENKPPVMDITITEKETKDIEDGDEVNTANPEDNSEDDSTKKTMKEKLIKPFKSLSLKREPSKEGSVEISPPAVEVSVKKKEIIAVEALPVQKEAHERKPFKIKPKSKDSESEGSDEPKDTSDTEREKSVSSSDDEKNKHGSAKATLLKPIKFISQKVHGKRATPTPEREEPLEVLPEEERANITEETKEEEITETKDESDPKDTPNSDDNHHHSTAKETLMKPIKYISGKLHHRRTTPTPEREVIQVEAQPYEIISKDEIQAEPAEQVDSGDTITTKDECVNTCQEPQEEPTEEMIVEEQFTENIPNDDQKEEEPVPLLEDKEMVEISSPTIKVEVEEKEIIGIEALPVQAKVKTKKPLKLFTKKKDKEVKDDDEKLSSEADTSSEMNQSQEGSDSGSLKRGIKATFMKPFRSHKKKKEGRPTPDRETPPVVEVDVPVVALIQEEKNAGDKVPDVDVGESNEQPEVDQTESEDKAQIDSDEPKADEKEVQVPESPTEQEKEKPNIKEKLIKPFKSLSLKREDQLSEVVAVSAPEIEVTRKEKEVVSVDAIPVEKDVKVKKPLKIMGKKKKKSEVTEDVSDKPASEADTSSEINESREGSESSGSLKRGIKATFMKTFRSHRKNTPTPEREIEVQPVAVIEVEKLATPDTDKVSPIDEEAQPTDVVQDKDIDEPDVEQQEQPSENQPEEILEKEVEKDSPIVIENEEMEESKETSPTEDTEMHDEGKDKTKITEKIMKPFKSLSLKHGDKPQTKEEVIEVSPPIIDINVEKKQVVGVEALPLQTDTIERRKPLKIFSKKKKEGKDETDKTSSDAGSSSEASQCEGSESGSLKRGIKATFMKPFKSHRKKKEGTPTPEREISPTVEVEVQPVTIIQEEKLPATPEREKTPEVAAIPDTKIEGIQEIVQSEELPPTDSEEITALPAMEINLSIEEDTKDTPEDLQENINEISEPTAVDTAESNVNDKTSIDEDASAEAIPSDKSKEIVEISPPVIAISKEEKEVVGVEVLPVQKDKKIRKPLKLFSKKPRSDKVSPDEVDKESSEADTSSDMNQSGSESGSLKRGIKATFMKPFMSKDKKKDISPPDEDDNQTIEETPGENGEPKLEKEHRSSFRDTLSKPLKKFQRKKTPTPDREDPIQVERIQEVPLPVILVQKEEQTSAKETLLKPVKYISGKLHHNKERSPSTEINEQPIDDDAVQEEQIQPVQAPKRETSFDIKEEDAESESKSTLRDTLKRPLKIFKKKNKKKNQEDESNKDEPTNESEKEEETCGEREVTPIESSECEEDIVSEEAVEEDTIEPVHTIPKLEPIDMSFVFDTEILPSDENKSPENEDEVADQVVVEPEEVKAEPEQITDQEPTKDLDDQEIQETPLVVESQASSDNENKSGIKEKIMKPFKAIHLPKKGSPEPEEVIEVSSPVIEVTVEKEDVVGVEALPVQKDTKVKKPLKIFSKKKPKHDSDEMKEGSVEKSPSETETSPEAEGADTSFENGDESDKTVGDKPEKRRFKPLKLFQHKRHSARSTPDKEDASPVVTPQADDSPQEQEDESPQQNLKKERRPFALFHKRKEQEKESSVEREGSADPSEPSESGDVSSPEEKHWKFKPPKFFHRKKGASTPERTTPDKDASFEQSETDEEHRQSESDTDEAKPKKERKRRIPKFFSRKKQDDSPVIENEPIVEQDEDEGNAQAEIPDNDSPKDQPSEDNADQPDEKEKKSFMKPLKLFGKKKSTDDEKSPTDLNSSIEPSESEQESDAESKRKKRFHPLKIFHKRKGEYEVTHPENEEPHDNGIEEESPENKVETSDKDNEELEEYEPDTKPKRDSDNKQILVDPLPVDTAVEEKKHTKLFSKPKTDSQEIEVERPHVHVEQKVVKIVERDLDEEQPVQTSQNGVTAV